MRGTLVVAIVVGAVVAARAQAQIDLAGALGPVKDRFQAPALAAAVVRDGKLLGVGVCGVRSLAEGQAPAPVTPDDRWPICSCTKTMTRFMLAALVEQGRIDPQASLPDLLPGTPMKDDYRSVRLPDILAHRAGIQPYTRIGPRLTPALFELEGTPMEQRAKFVAHVLKEEPAAPPGTRFVYSNAGYAVAAVIAETKTGRSWEDLVRENVLVPLAMTGSVAGPEPEPEHQPVGHRRAPEGFRPVATRPYLPAMAPAGGVRATAADLARFAGAFAELQAGRAVGGISAATAAKMAEVRPGDQNGDANAPVTFFGGDGQYSAAVAIWPALNLGIAVVSNAGDSDDLCQDAVEAVRAAEIPEAPPQGGRPQATQGPRWGFQVLAESDVWKVGKVEPGSIAEKAGLKEGDEIGSINSNALKDAPEEKRLEWLRGNSATLSVKRGDLTLEVHLQR